MSDEVRKRIVELSEQLASSDEPSTEDLKDAVKAFDADGDDEVFLGRLREGALRFESSHPELSGVVARSAQLDRAPWPLRRRPR